MRLIGKSIPASIRRGLAAAAAGFLLLAGNAAGQLLQVPEPIPVPDGDTSFVGSVSVTFQQLSNALQGKIYYTTNGVTPTDANGTLYEDPIDISATTTLKAVRIRSGNRSAVHTAKFVKRKLPAPSIVYEGSASFTGSKKVTLSMPSLSPVPATPVKILYSTDASAPDSQYPSGGLTLSKTCVLKASATHADYDPSPVASVGFTLLQPVSKPVLSPAGGPFQSKNLAVSFRSATEGAYFQWSYGANSNPDTGSIDSSVVLVGGKPGETIVLRVIAKKTQMANSAVTEERYTYQPLPDPPVATPAPGPFYDSITVALKSPTAGTVIHYTLDGLTLPTRNTAKYDSTTKIWFDNTVTLKAIAFRETDLSNISGGTYTLNLSPPISSHASQEFLGTLAVTLRAKCPSAQIVYTLNGDAPTRKSAQFLSGDVIELDQDTTVLKAMAVSGDVESQVATYLYLRKSVIKTTAAPVIEPTGRNIQGSQVITITAEAGAAITYSLDNGPMLAYTGPITLSRTAVLTAIAKKGDLQASAARTETYVLVPSAPVADVPEGSYPNRVAVSLSPQTPGSQVIYSLGSGAFVPELALPYEKPLVFSAGNAATSQTVQAAAVLGIGDQKRISPVIVLNYTVFPSNPNDSLYQGQSRDLTQGISLSNKGPAPFSAKLGSFDQLGLAGFKDATHSVTLSAGTGQPAPYAAFTRPSGQTQAVYRLVSGRVEYVGAGATVEVAGAGTYFAAVDVQAPILSLAEQAGMTGDSTRVTLAVLDNVSNLSCRIAGSGLAEGGVMLAPDAGGKVVFHVKNARSELKNLWFKATASDAFNQATLPAAGDRYYVLQGWAKLGTPPVWNLGSSIQPYDLAGFPIGKTARLTWKQVRLDNPDPSLTAYLYRDPDYVPLQDSMTMEPGMAFWLGSRNAYRSLQLSNFRTAGSDPDGRFRVYLKPGWNMVTNPSLEVLHWPSRHDAQDYLEKPVRGLWEYKLQVLDVDATDSLVPWRGYWVLNAGTVDRVVELLTAPAPGTLGKSAAAGDPGTVDIRLDYGRPATLRLGAASYARDGLGIEDEPSLPAGISPRSGPPQREGWSAREGGRLMTDLLRLSGEVLRWKVVLAGTPAAGRDSLVRVKQSRLPPGYEAWAWSPRRNLKVRLETGAAYSLPGSGPDTLLVMAGPSAKLAVSPELAGAVESVEAFASRLAAGRGGPRLLLDLPTDARVEAGLWSASGRRLAVIQSGTLGSGRHALAIPASKAGRQIVIVRLTARGPGWREDRIHRVAW